MGLIHKIQGEDRERTYQRREDSGRVLPSGGTCVDTQPKGGVSYLAAFCQQPTFPLMWECVGGSVLKGENSIDGEDITEEKILGDISFQEQYFYGKLYR